MPVGAGVFRLYGLGYSSRMTQTPNYREITRDKNEDLEFGILTSSPFHSHRNSSMAQSTDDETPFFAAEGPATKGEESEDVEIDEDLVNEFKDVLQRKDYAFENRDKMTLELLQYNKDHMVGDEQQSGRRLLMQFLASRFLWIDMDKSKKISSGLSVESDEACQQVVQLCINRCSRPVIRKDKIYQCYGKNDNETDISEYLRDIFSLESVMDTCLSIPKLRPYFLPLAESKSVHYVSLFSDYIMGLDIIPHYSYYGLPNPDKIWEFQEKRLAKYYESLYSVLPPLLETVCALLERYPNYSPKPGFVCDQPLSRYIRLFELLSFREWQSSQAAVEVRDLLIEYHRDTGSQNEYYDLHLESIDLMQDCGHLFDNKCILEVVQPASPTVATFGGKVQGLDFGHCEKNTLCIPSASINRLLNDWNSFNTKFRDHHFNGVPSWAEAVEYGPPVALNLWLRMITLTNECTNNRFILVTLCVVNALFSQLDFCCPVAHAVLSKYLNDLKFSTIMRSTLRYSETYRDDDHFKNKQHITTDWLLDFKHSQAFHRRQMKRMALIAQISQVVCIFNSRIDDPKNASVVNRDRYEKRLYTLLSRLSVLY